MESTQARILQTAHELFFKYGFKNISMDDIAQKLGISKKTLYQFYKDKNDLVFQVTQFSLNCSESDQNQIVTGSENAIDEIIKVMAHIKIIFTQMHPAFTYELEKYFPKAWKLFLKFKEEKIQQKITNNLNRGIEEGVYRNTMDIGIIVSIRMNQFETAFTYSRNHQVNLADVHTQMLEHYLYGICSLKGYKLLEKYKKRIKS